MAKKNDTPQHAVCVCVCVCVCIYIYIYVCVCVYIYIYIYILINTCARAYTHTQNRHGTVCFELMFLFSFIVSYVSCIIFVNGELFQFCFQSGFNND
uniref:Uncharacterized protein n=1 Tax=Gasterosteus aculeatus TaxID=69293 RepID=G3PAM9_GASAC